MIDHKVEAPPFPPDSNGSHTLEAGHEIKALPPAPTPRRRRGRGFLWLLLLGAAAFLGYRYYRSSEEKKAAAAAAQAQRQAHRAVSIAAAPARRGDLPVYLRGLGNVTAYNTVNLRTRVDGPLVAVNFKEGQYVNKGEVLAIVDPRSYDVAVQQAEGNLARDEAQLNDARVNLARYQKLWEEGVIARQQLDTQAAQVGQFDGVIAVDQANIANAKLNQSFTKITAPISGRIGLRQVDIGNIVHAGDATPMAVITQMQPIAVLFTLPADSLPPVLAKLRAHVSLPVEAYDRADINKIASGTLETVDNQIDSSTGTSRLKAIFANADNALFPNQFVNCRLLLETRHNAVLVPASAIQQGPQGPYAYVVKPDQTATMRPVTVGITEGTDEEVRSGVAPGDLVVTDGQDKLQENSHVEVRQVGQALSPARVRSVAAPRGQAKTPAPPK